MKRIYILLLAILSIVLPNILFTSCVEDEDFATDSSISLKFSSDTLSFDTIFTTVGSITKQIRVFNPENSPIKIDRITLGGGNSSYFRLNVDGDTSLVAKDIEIAAKDSIFIFVRVELEPNNQNNPFLIQDSIILSFNNKEQYVQLMAYGQDAYFHKPSHVLGNGDNQIPYSLVNEGGAGCGVDVSGNNVTWRTDKPHVILGTCVVDSAFTLNLQSGTNIYMASGADFWVYTGGSLQAQGTTNAPVKFTSLRHQDRYSDIPGQWGKIWFWAGSMDNVLDNVVIKNAFNGIQVDSCVTNNPTIHISNSFIQNCSNVGLYSQGATIEAENLLIQNTGNYSLALTIGGSYRFINCTFANYWFYDTSRKRATVFMNDWYESIGHEIQIRPITRAEFYNTVIYGTLTGDEIEFDLIDDGIHSNYSFDHCLLKTSSLNSSSANISNCIFNIDPLFADPTNNDLHPMENSPLIDAGNGVWNSLIAFDIYGVLRNDPPTIGAVEYTATNQIRQRL